MFSTPEAAKLLSVLASELPSSEPPTASGAEKQASSSGARQRSAAEPEKKRDSTPEQRAVVKRVRTCKITDYYEILAVKKDCEEAEIKKAYRKVSCFIQICSIL